MKKMSFEKRDITGKKSKKLYEEGKIPAVVYNSKGDSTNIQITISDASKIAREATSTTILDAEFGKKKLKVVVKEIEINPFTDQLRHVAFFEIDENKEMVFTIPFEIVGVAPAIKNNLGVLVDVLNSVDVRCKLSDLVPFIEVDISKLEHPGQSISVDEIGIPKGMELVNEELATATIVTITEMQKEEVIEPEVTEAEEGEEGIEGEEGVEEEQGEGVESTKASPKE